ncbi:hypothetical protein B0H63DRAFT_468437 [Podospora didyma]|uniref:Protein kinase domain-containing protein n=1 Tax=Podospora didyma TaxID=330526 RepID=A0AAE0NSI1_9PEZI|nr:hypothetical protein B0H63DRAFT_468437 [Podospora didyma]
MELASNVIPDLLSPLAAFTTLPPYIDQLHIPNADQDELDLVANAAAAAAAAAVQDSAATNQSGCVTPVWETSPVNPQSRIDSLAPLPSWKSTSTWRLDGADVDGRRFFAVPTFALGCPPLRIDVYVPPPEAFPPALRAVLQPDAVVYTCRNKTVQALPIAQHLVRALTKWSASIPDFESQYAALPFGSQVYVASMAASLGAMEIHLVPDHGIEQAMLSVDALQDTWHQLVPKESWPPILDWADLKLVKQLHEAITVVTINETQMVFKSLLRDQRYMYNELKMLLALAPHPHRIPRPAYVVAKRARFGRRRGVCGFVVPYYPLGSLKDRLRQISASDDLESTLGVRFKWAMQITQALIAVNEHPAGFYPDLKPDNVVLRAGGDGQQVDAVLLDFEQRGGWFTWSPPEVVYVEYLEILAAAPALAGDEGGMLQAEITAQLREYIPGWTPARQNDRYRNVDGGFSAPWLALVRDRQAQRQLDSSSLPSSSNESKMRDDSLLQKAQVFMLGKLFWCIFEAQPRLRSGIDHEVLQENLTDLGSKPGPVFPEFWSTPMVIRDLIQACTAGAPEWDEDAVQRRKSGVVLWRGKLIPAAAVSAARRAPGTLGYEFLENFRAEQTQEAARLYWADEARRARELMVELLEEMRHRRQQRGEDLVAEPRPDHGKRKDEVKTLTLLEKCRARPTLDEVYGELMRAASGV